MTEVPLSKAPYLFVCALWMGYMQSMNSEYGSPYLAVCHFHFSSLLMNWLMSWIRCVRWGRQRWAAPGHFWKPFQRHVLKCDWFKIYYMHSFKAALIAFLVTSWLNWPWHCMHIVYFALWYEMRPATARAIEDRAQYCFRARLTRACRWSEAEARNISRLMWS